MHTHGCLCSFVPPAPLNRLARKSDPARRSIYKSKQARDNRQAKTEEVAGLAVAVSRGSAQREVYDCKHTWNQRENIVRDENGPATGDDAADDAFDHAGSVRSYFKDVLARDSINGTGMDLILNVHFGVDYMNAFWDGDEMTFGDGDGEIFTTFSRSLDVVAHELAHGVTQFTAGLRYRSQSGALNEHFSDVFGTAITQWVAGQSADDADWLIGDEIMGPELYGEALRSMSAPGTAYANEFLGVDPQPAHMRDYYAGNADRQGVHINSGIPNRAFYRVAMEIGTDKATLIWYEALLNLWPTTNFNEATQVIGDAARRLTRDNKVPLGSTQAVRMAFKSVGLPK
ncbi:MAG: M4 family metallopeptidase [Actinomycetota bacterium]